MTSNDELKERIRRLERGVVGLLLVGIGHLVMVGVYKERVDTAVRSIEKNTRQLSAVTVTVQKTRLELAKLKGRLRDGG